MYSIIIIKKFQRANINILTLSDYSRYYRCRSNVFIDGEGNPGFYAPEPKKSTHYIICLEYTEMIIILLYISYYNNIMLLER